MTQMQYNYIKTTLQGLSSDFSLVSDTASGAITNISLLYSGVNGYIKDFSAIPMASGATSLLSGLALITSGVDEKIPEYLSDLEDGMNQFQQVSDVDSYVAILDDLSSNYFARMEELNKLA